MSSNRTISDIVDFNPKRPIKKGETKPFIEMAALPVDNRDVSELGEREFKGGGSKFKNGDTLFARITPCLENGKTAKVNCLNQDEHGHGSTEFIVMSAKEPEYDEDYVYYLARHPEFRAYAQSRMEGTSGRQRVAWQSLAEFEFDYPDKDIRKEAGKFLKEIDDKVALNAKTNQTLEQIAQALFKSWFVDFDPVKAKIETLAAGGSADDAELAAMSVISAKTLDELNSLKASNSEAFNKLAQTAAIFPEKLVESQLGLIPEGWKDIALYDLAEFINGAAYKKFEPNNEGIGLPIVKIAELKSGISQNTGFSTVKMPEKYRLKDKDILFSWSGNPDTSIDTFIWALGEAWLNQHIFKVVPKPNVNRSYVLSLLKFMRPVFAEIARDKQTTGLGHVTVKDLQRLKVAVPPKELLVKFDEKVDSFIAQSFGLVKQNQTLELLRDNLLPKLLSGEIDLTSEVVE